MRSPGGEVDRSGAFGTVGEDGDASQRTLFVLAVADYGDGDEDFTKGVNEQVDVVSAWWSTSGLEPAFRQVRAPELMTRDEVEDFVRAENIRTMRGDALVLFITGHGMAASSKTHYLVLPASDKNRKINTSVRTVDLVAAALDSHADNVLVIVNTCYAGQIRGELADMFHDISKTRRGRCKLDVLVTCDHDSPVRVRRFPTLLKAAFHRLRTTAGITRPHLSMSEFMTEFEKGLRPEERRHHQLHRVIDNSSFTEPNPCLPNPGYRPVPEIFGSGLANTGIDGYWLDRATGRTQDNDSGWYFKGRDDLNRTIASLLSGPQSRGVLLLTGSAGSGKSAVLARAVVLSDPVFREAPVCKAAMEQAPEDTVPGAESVTVAVLARRRSAAQVATDILTGLGGTAQTPGASDDPVVVWVAQICEILRTRGEGAAVVLDGLDECDERQDIIDKILTPLKEFSEPLYRVPQPRADAETGPGGLRLLIGVRSSRPASDPGGVRLDKQERGLVEILKETFPSARVERTDDEGTKTDIEHYIAALIGNGVNPGAAAEAAAVVAPEAWPSFLDARIAGEQLKGESDPVGRAKDPQWQKLLKGGTTGLLRRDLLLVADEGLPTDVAHALLRASAFAGGLGVPWANIWPRMAQVFMGRTQVDNWDEMIAKLLSGRLNGYLTHDHQDDRRVYRPAHDKLSEALIDGRLLDSEDAA
ncbi:ATP-binding protein [Actinacidiphila cocklensis]|uniref:ATP-binding protein n=2 Tax=Actinacidiphila cocklensis TaxID=887465 RepID=A0A9W4GR96_9ACTN|nr:ATP-binding protein [Actinacidiphila cocklensis]